MTSVKLLYNKELVNIVINNTHLALSSNSTNQPISEYPINCIYGIQTPNETQNELIVNLYALTSPSASNTENNKLVKEEINVIPSPQRYALTFRLPENTDITWKNEKIEEFIKKLHETSFPNHQQHSATKIYGFINPTAGSRQARHSWNTIVKPMLQSAGFQNFTEIETIADKVRQQGKQLGELIHQDNQQQQQHIIISLGGDGTLHDLFNGLTDYTLDNLHEHIHYRIGVIPSGSGNAFALSLGQDKLYSVEQATLKIIHGELKPFYLLDVDIGHVDKKKNQQEEQNDDNDWSLQFQSTQSKEERRRIFVVLSWGFHAQILSKSRYLRYVMGNKRFSLVALLLTIFLKQYQGDIILKGAQLQKYDKVNKALKTLTDDYVQLSSNDSRGGFTYFLATKQSSLEPGFNITPLATPFDKEMDIMVMRQATANHLKQVAGLAFQGQQEHLQHDYVDYYKASELYLRVHEGTEICLDGEIISVNANDVIHLKLIQHEDKNEPRFSAFV
ncbi:unnamed protein product [Cunninghamella echinulata]